ncbi:hypothetical protein JCM8097_007871 [Rhodosporidiobolus ruineniae]
MTLRLAVTYARLFIRDRSLYRMLVTLCALLASGHTATFCADAFFLVTPVHQGPDLHPSRHSRQTALHIITQTFTVAVMVTSQVFFLARLWSVTRNLLIRIATTLLLLAATVMLIYWSVEEVQLKSITPVADGKFGYLGIAAGWLLTATAIFNTCCLYIILPKARPLENPPSTRLGKLVSNVSLFIESSGLIALDHLLSSIIRLFALHFPTATHLVTFFWFLFPSISILSVLHAVNQRCPPPLPPRTTVPNCSISKMTNGLINAVGLDSTEAAHLAPSSHLLQPTPSLDLSSSKRAFLPVASNPSGLAELAYPAASNASAFGVALATGAGMGGTIIYDPDDPQTWRGDAQRMFPSIRFDEPSPGEVGDEELALGPVGSRPGSAAGSAGGAGGAGGGAAGGGRRPSMRSLAPSTSNSTSLGGRPTFVRTRSTDTAGRRSLTPSYGRAGGGVYEYDEEAIEAEPTVLSLNLDAFSTVKAPAWGPKETIEEDDHDEPASTPSTRSTPDLAR